MLVMICKCKKRFHKLCSKSECTYARLVCMRMSTLPKISRIFIITYRASIKYCYASKKFDKVQEKHYTAFKNTEFRNI